MTTTNRNIRWKPGDLKYRTEELGDDKKKAVEADDEYQKLVQREKTRAYILGLDRYSYLRDISDPETQAERVDEIVDQIEGGLNAVYLRSKAQGDDPEFDENARTNPNFRVPGQTQIPEVPDKPENSNHQ